MFDKEITRLKQQHLFRTLLSRGSSQGAVILINRKRYLNFASNDYLGLAADPDVIRAAAEAAARYGFGSGASRLLAGGSLLHERLEKEVAAFKSAEAALVFNSGYAANTGIIPALAAGGDQIFSDELNHASIVDGCRLSGARTLIYRHKDPAHLEALLRKGGRKGRLLVITDSVFSMDGDIAPLDDIAALCRKYHALLYIDDAHATGVLGNGKGGLAHFGIAPEPWIIQMGTFSKALGSFGAFAAGSRDLTDWIVNKARSFLFSTALPAAVIGASRMALQIVRKDRKRRERLQANRAMLADGLRRIGMDIRGSETPILPVRTADVETALRLSEQLFRHGIYAPAIRPPTVAEPRIRITVSAGHTEEQLERLLEILQRVQ
ncbi:MAG: 8-amino-7-oxononanoate synthase [Nitrospirae bacterium]|nr:MAG: 8-amino-7-oxononanoate synthase [Nitrospirota bacterium]